MTEAALLAALSAARQRPKDQGHTIRQIAEALGVSEMTARRRVRVAQQLGTVELCWNTYERTGDRAILRVVAYRMKGKQ